MARIGTLVDGSSGLRTAPAAAVAQREAAAVAAAARRDVAGSFAIRLVDSLDGLAALRDPWTRLERAAGSAQIFQSYAWCSAWARLYAAPGSGYRLTILAGYDDGRLVSIWPMMTVAAGPIRILRFLSEPYGQYGDVLVEPGPRAETWIAAMWGHLTALPGIDVVRVRHVRADAVVAAFARARMRPAGYTETAPFMDLTRFDGETGYEARYTKVQRKRRRRIRKSLEERGPLHFELHRSGETYERLVDTVIGRKRGWLRQRGLHSRPLACPLTSVFLKELARGGGDGVTPVISVLRAGDDEISYELGLRYRDRHCGYITAHDDALTEDSPARLHMDLSQRRALTDGLAVFDLMVPGDRHKASWSNRTVAVDDFYTPLTWKGHLYGRLYLGLVRPLLRRLYYGSSPAVRRAVASVAKV